MAYVTPKTWATNDLATAAQLNQDLRDNVKFLATPPSCRVFNSATISHATSGSFQYLTFNSERFDTDTMHSTSVSTGRITFTTAGKYLVGGQVKFSVNATGMRGLQIRLNGATEIANVLLDTGTALDTHLTIATYYQFAAADYVELGAFQSSGGALNMLLGSNYSPEFWAVWQSL